MRLAALSFSIRYSARARERFMAVANRLPGGNCQLVSRTISSSTSGSVPRSFTFRASRACDSPRLWRTGAASSTIPPPNVSTGDKKRIIKRSSRFSTMGSSNLSWA